MQSAAKVHVHYRPFPCSIMPLFQSESKCETILMKITFTVAVTWAFRECLNKTVSLAGSKKSLEVYSCLLTIYHKL